ncbi:MAG: hypothetical protein ACXWYS_05105 [Gaiellaceae bacterium]
MQALPPETLTALAATMAAGVLMARIGMSKGLLARRVPAERCASCGNRVRGPGCAHCRRRNLD